VIAAGGTLGILIPPSIPLIIYGFVTEESVNALFLAGVGPGLMLIIAFIAYSVVRANLFGGWEPIAKASGAERIAASRRALPTLALAGLIIGGIYSGAFTPTEAAGIGFIASLAIVGLVLKTLTWAKLGEAVHDAMATTVAVLMIVAGAKVFAKAITLYRIPQDISAWIATTVEGPATLVLVVALVLLGFGLMLEALAMILIMTPVLLPAALAMGIDPIWFGVFMVIMVECALITPPVGLNLFVIQSVGQASLIDVSRGALPFLAIMLASVFVIYIWPDLALYLAFRL
jgi:C4-dicarboxylate transporter DctM subunit